MIPEPHDGLWTFMDCKCRHSQGANRSTDLHFCGHMRGGNFCETNLHYRECPRGYAA